jgi:hypothetical protein
VEAGQDGTIAMACRLLEISAPEGSKIRKGVIVAGIGSGWRHRASMVRRVEEQVGGPVRSSEGERWI